MELSTVPQGESAAAREERWQLVNRIAASRHLAKAPQLREIFFYIARRSLDDPGAPIRELEIGCEALGRKVEFDPHHDNIVRVQISHLRKKLSEYFLNEGAQEPLRVVVPKGSYVPVFEPNEPVVNTAVFEGPVAASPRHRPSWFLASSATLICFSALALAYIWKASAVPSTDAPRAEGVIWKRIFAGDKPASVVVADTCLVMLQDILHTDIPVNEYSSGNYAEHLLAQAKDHELAAALRLIASRQYTSLGDINIATRLVDVSRGFGPDRARIRYTRHLNIRDFKSDNFVLIGSRRGIPWVQLFEPQLNFAFVEDSHTRAFHFENKSPKAGEQSTYLPSSEGGIESTYAVVALLPNLGNSGNVLLLSGITMEAAEAAGEFVVSSRMERDIEHLLQLDAKRLGAAYFELLLRIRTVAGAPKSSEIAAYRLLQPAQAEQ